MKLVLSNHRQVRIHLAAFSLVETVIGFGIVGILVVSLFAGISAGFGIIKSSRENARATQVLLEKMEQLRLTTFDDLANMPTNFIAPFYAVGDNLADSGGFSYTGTLSVASLPGGVDYNGNLKQITVAVNWNVDNLDHARSISSFVSRNGLYSYKFWFNTN